MGRKKKIDITSVDIAEDQFPAQITPNETVDEGEKTIYSFSLVSFVNNSDLDENSKKVFIDKFSDMSTKLIEMHERAKSLVIESVDDIDKMAQAKEGKRAVGKIRNAIENTRADLKSKSLQEGRMIDAIAKELQALVAPIEEELEQKANYAINKKREEMDSLRAERLEEVRPFMEYVPLDKDLGAMSLQEYKIMLAGVKSLYEEAEKERQAEEDARKAEEERRDKEEALHASRKDQLLDYWLNIEPGDRGLHFGRMSDEDFEKIKSDAIKNKEEAEAKQEEERLAAEARIEKSNKRAAVQQKLMPYWDFMTEEQRSMDFSVIDDEVLASMIGNLEQEKKDIERGRSRYLEIYSLMVAVGSKEEKSISLGKIDQKSFDELKALLSKRQDDLNKEKDRKKQEAIRAAEEKTRKEQEDRENAKKEKAEQERKRAEANAPDKEKLIKLADSIKAMALPELVAEDGNAILKNIKVLIGKLTNYITENANKL